jgi:hypothetical protein
MTGSGPRAQRQLFSQSPYGVSWHDCRVADAEGGAAARLKAGLAQAIRRATSRPSGAGVDGGSRGHQPRPGGAAKQRAVRQPNAGKPELVAIAADPASEPKALWRVALRSRHPAVSRALAANPSAPPRLLRFLGHFARWDVLVTLAGSPRTPLRMQSNRLASSLDWAVAAAVAANPATRPEVLGHLASRRDPRIGLAAAANPSLAGDLVEALLQSPSVYVRGVAAANPAAPSEALRRLAAGMSEPAWVLRAIAANPSCPADLSDQLLTWLTLGGPGNADPLFDPVRCTGHPASSDVPPVAWYAEEAKRADAARHPLWRVRAAVASAHKQLPLMTVSMLRRDPRPEVRRSVAGFIGTRPSEIRELIGDADAAVAWRAAQVRRANRRKYLRRRVLRRGLGLLPLAAIGIPFAVVASITPPAPSGTSPIVGSRVVLCVPKPGWLTGGWTTGTMARPSTQPTISLPGGGWLACGPSSSGAKVFLVATGSSGLILDAASPVQSPQGTRYDHKPVLLSAAQQNLFYIVGNPRLVAVTIGPDSNQSQVFTVTLAFPPGTP